VLRQSNKVWVHAGIVPGLLRSLFGLCSHFHWECSGVPGRSPNKVRTTCTQCQQQSRLKPGAILAIEVGKTVNLFGNCSGMLRDSYGAASQICEGNPNVVRRWCGLYPNEPQRKAGTFPYPNHPFIPSIPVQTYTNWQRLKKHRTATHNQYACSFTRSINFASNDFLDA
jgi:hypothetical protein